MTWYAHWRIIGGSGWLLALTCPHSDWMQSGNTLRTAGVTRAYGVDEDAATVGRLRPL